MKSVGVIGGSGYTGGELIRIILRLYLTLIIIIIINNWCGWTQDISPKITFVHPHHHF